MCGRFSLSTPAEILADRFQLTSAPSLAPRYNIAPTQPVAAVRLTPGHEGRMLELLRWGLIPPWAKDPSLGAQLINARAETAATKPAFRAAFRQRRCLVPADGFYEWQREGLRKQPFYIRMRDGKPFAFAGLWEHWEGLDGAAIDSCALLTTEPNELLRPVHDRMPVILDPRDYELWLDPEVRKLERLTPLLRPYPPEDMTAYPVSPRVNNPRNDDPLCTEPLRGCLRSHV